MSASEPPLGFFAYTALWTGTDLASDLREIGQEAMRNNTRDDVTGVLIFDRGRFIQAVEGPAEALLRLRGRIQNDPRCSDLEVLFDQTVRERSMRDWTLKMLRLDDRPGIDPEAIKRFRNAYERGFAPDAEGFATLLVALITDAMG